MSRSTRNGIEPLGFTAQLQPTTTPLATQIAALVGATRSARTVSKAKQTALAAGVVNTYTGTTSQGYPITIELNQDGAGPLPIRQFWFYPSQWVTQCLAGGPKIGGVAFFADYTQNGKLIRFDSRDFQNVWQGDLRLSEDGTEPEGAFTLLSSLFVDAEQSLKKATSCRTGRVTFKAAVSSALHQ
jgi:hypothetical protein